MGKKILLVTSLFILACLNSLHIQHAYQAFPACAQKQLSAHVGKAWHTVHAATVRYCELWFDHDDDSLTDF